MCSSDLEAILGLSPRLVEQPPLRWRPAGRPPSSYPYKYFLNVPAVTATLSAKSVANGNTIKVGCRLKGNAK